MSELTTGTELDRYCPNCEQMTVHNTHWRCLGCFRKNPPERGSDE